MSSLFQFHLSVVDAELQQDLQALAAHDVSEIFSQFRSLPRICDRPRDRMELAREDTETITFAISRRRRSLCCDGKPTLWTVLSIARFE